MLVLCMLCFKYMKLTAVSSFELLCQGRASLRQRVTFILVVFGASVGPHFDRRPHLLSLFARRVILDCILAFSEGFLEPAGSGQSCSDSLRPESHRWRQVQQDCLIQSILQ